MKTWIGIDPGCAGAIAAIAENADVRIRPLAIRKDADGMNIVDVDIFESDLRLLACSHEVAVLVEEPLRHAMSSANTIASCWRNFGRIQAILDFIHFPHSAVPPRTWQPKMLGKVGKGESKNASIAMAKQLFPDATLRRSLRCRTDDDGFSDALLLAAYLRAYVDTSKQQTVFSARDLDAS